jgi:predicted alpha/beta-fold hydrolase
MLKFTPAQWLKNPHLQTLYPALLRKNPLPQQLHRERLITPDHDFIDIDICGTGTAPLVILLHGLTGSSKSSYIKGLQTVLLQQGFRSVALNFRGCSGEYNHLARSYHSGETEDLHFLYQTLRQCEPNTPIAVIGFSLGGSVLLNWLGKYGEQVSLFAAVGISVPLLLDVCATKLDKGFSKLYRGVLLRDLKHYMSAKQQHLTKIGALEEAGKIKQLGNLSNINSFWQYDDHVVAPLHGFNNVHDYYKRCSARQFLHSITVPTLLIQSLDDPFMTREVLPSTAELSPAVKLELSLNGGHVGFVSGKSLFKPVYWLEHRIMTFLKHQYSQL